ncbi:MAG: 30S ribosomal protein S2 [bacterium]|nr:30S ribosomal protein S2 [bacterium]
MPNVKEIKTEGLNFDLEEMGQAGLHFGHRTSRINPKINPYLYGVRNNVHIFDLEKTAEKLKEALSFIQQIIKEGKVMILVGTKIQVKNLSKEMAKECGLLYVVERWLGGTLTNFETIKKRIEYFKSLEKKKEEGELEKYTKKERANFDKEIKDLEMKFGGIKNLEKLPDAIFVLDMKKDNLAVKEARAKGVKVIGIADTNTDPTLADYPIPANDDAISSVRYILEKMKEAILKSNTSSVPRDEAKERTQFSSPSEIKK